MWIKTYSVTAANLQPHQVWQIWSDMKQRPKWDIDTEWATLDGPFETGAIFHFKPKGGPKLSMRITDCIPNKRFTDCFKIPFARMYGIHEMERTDEGLKITTSIKVEGLLGWLLRKMVAEKVFAEIPQQTEALIKLAEQIK